MSFRCGCCGLPQQAGTKPVHLVTKVRLLLFEPIQTRDREGMLVISSRSREEIVEEKLACYSCASKAGKPEVVEVVQKGGDGCQRESETGSKSLVMMTRW